MRVIIISILLLANQIAFSQGAKNMTLSDTWSDGSLVATTAHDNTYNDIWGYAQGGKEYALIGSTAGVHIIDVTDPFNVSEVVFVPGTQPSTQFTSIVHRDIKTYKNYMYMVSDEGSAALQIIDLSNLPTSVNEVYNSTTLFNHAHNVYIDSSKAKLYVCGATNKFAAYSLADPVNPTFIWEQSTSTDQWAIDMGYVHDVFIRNDTAYMNAGPNGLYVAKFSTNPPTFLGNITTYPEQGYNHSGWLHDTKPVYVQGDETHGKKLKAFDVSDLADIKTLSTFGSDVDLTYSIPHNQLILGDLAFSSYYFDGIYAFDISDASNPKVRGFYDTSTIPAGSNYRGCWGVYPFLPSGTILASDMQNGLFVIDGSQMYSTNGIEENDHNNLLIYPSITDGKVIVKNLSNSIEIATITVQDISGKAINITSESTNVRTTILNFDNLTNGLYFVTVLDTNKKSYTQKIIKK